MHACMHMHLSKTVTAVSRCTESGLDKNNLTLNFFKKKFSRAKCCKKSCKFVFRKQSHSLKFQRVGLYVYKASFQISNIYTTKCYVAPALHKLVMFLKSWYVDLEVNRGTFHNYILSSLVKILPTYSRKILKPIHSVT